jgi:hypothetical protein
MKRWLPVFAAAAAAYVAAYFVVPPPVVIVVGDRPLLALLAPEPE